MLPKATNTEDEKLRKAYEDAYKKSDEENWNLLSTLKAVVTVVDPLETLRKVQNEWKSEFLSANRGAVANMEQAEKDEVNRYLQGRIGAITSEIDELQKALPSAKVLLPGVMEENGIPISPEDLKRDPGTFLLLNSLLRSDSIRAFQTSDQRTNKGKGRTISLDKGKIQIAVAENIMLITV